MKKAKLIFISIFIVLCLIPSVGMLIFGEARPAANEVLAGKPSVTTRSGELSLSFLSDVSDYIADRFAFRQALATAWDESQKAGVAADSGSAADPAAGADAADAADGPDCSDGSCSV